MERVISGLIGIPIVLGIILYGHSLLFFILVTSLVLLATQEYFSMITNAGKIGFPHEGLALSFLLLVFYFFVPKYLGLIGILIPFTLFITSFFRKNNADVAIDAIVYTLFGIFYIAGLGGYFLLIGKMEGGREMVVFILLLIWAGDSMAYYVGRKYGKSKPFKMISPNKTTAGAFANIIGTLIIAALASILFFDKVPLIHCLIVSFICGIIGQCGDLLESLIKRSCKTKDSGNLIPGHGGVLDRIDSLLFAGPVFYCYYQFLLTIKYL